MRPFVFATDVRLKRFADEKTSLKAEVQLLTQQLEEIREQRRPGTTNGGPPGDEDFEEAQSTFGRARSTEFNTNLSGYVYSHRTGEANKQLADLRYKLQRAEQEVASLQSSLSRSETQVVRFKTSADESEKAETELKGERRKLQREVRSVRMMDVVGLIYAVDRFSCLRRKSSIAQEFL